MHESMIMLEQMLKEAKDNMIQQAQFVDTLTNIGASDSNINTAKLTLAKYKNEYQHLIRAKEKAMCGDNI